MKNELEIIRKALEQKVSIPFGNIFYSEDIGINIDKYNEIVVLQWWNRKLEKKIKDLLNLIEEFGIKNIIERNDIKKRKLKGLKRRKRILRGRKHRTIIQINNIKFFVDCLNGQRTGFYLDQLENYKKFLEIAPESNFTLDLFSYTGAYGIHSKKFSEKVLCVDKSLYAIKEGYNNVRINKLENVDFIKSDVLEFLFNFKENPDIVIIDPSYATEDIYILRVLRRVIKLEPKLIIFINRKNIKLKPLNNMIIWK